MRKKNLKKLLILTILILKVFNNNIYQKFQSIIIGFFQDFFFFFSKKIFRFLCAVWSPFRQAISLNLHTLIFIVHRVENDFQFHPNTSAILAKFHLRLPRATRIPTISTVTSTAAAVRNRGLKILYNIKCLLNQPAHIVVARLMTA